MRIHKDVLLLPESTSMGTSIQVLVHFPIVTIVLISCVIFVRIVQEDFLLLDAENSPSSVPEPLN